LDQPAGKKRVSISNSTARDKKKGKQPIKRQLSGKIIEEEKRIEAFAGVGSPGVWGWGLGVWVGGGFSKRRRTSRLTRKGSHHNREGEEDRAASAGGRGRKGNFFYIPGEKKRHVPASGMSGEKEMGQIIAFPREKWAFPDPDRQDRKKGGGNVLPNYAYKVEGDNGPPGFPTRVGGARQHRREKCVSMVINQ